MRDTTRFAFLTSMGSDVEDVFSTETLKQQPLGTSTCVVDLI